MEWKVNIENKPNQRILVKFDPLNELIIFIGQYKPHNENWVDFSKEEYTMDIDLKTMQDLLFNVYKTMNNRLEAFNNISEGFTFIKKIEISEE
jgi:hypothetical protein